jgi:hypothetical protein
MLQCAPFTAVLANQLINPNTDCTPDIPTYSTQESLCGKSRRPSPWVLFGNITAPGEKKSCIQPCASACKPEQQYPVIYISGKEIGQK